jgi:hypothetical protein
MSAFDWYASAGTEKPGPQAPADEWPVIRSCVPAPGPFAHVPITFLQADSPLRPPDWRYRMALALVHYGRQPDVEDQDLAAIYEVLQRLRQPGATGEPWPAALAPYHAALQIHLESVDYEQVILEAGLLARRSPETAALAIGQPPEVGQAYAAVFYDVQDRLRLCTFMMDLLHLLEPVPALAYVLRACAFQRGQQFLDALLPMFGLGRYVLTPAPIEDTPEYDDLAVRGVVAVMLLPNTPSLLRFLSELAQRYDQVSALEHDPERYVAAQRELFKAQLAGARRQFGVAARDHPFLATLFTPNPQVA